MTCREKLSLMRPDAIDPDCWGGCRGCPTDYNMLPKPEYCKPIHEICTKCWNREIPETTEVNETVSVEDLLKFVNGLDIDGKMISVSFYEDSTTVTISKFEKGLE